MVADVFVKQLDGSAYQGANCMAAGDAMLVARATQNTKRPTGATIRRLTGDTYGGLNMSQVQDVDARYYGFTPRRFQPMAWTDVLALGQDRPFGICVGYGPIEDTSHDASRHRFRDNHFMFVPRRTSTGFKVGDPLADGRYAGCPNGYQVYSFSLLRRAAGALDLSGLGTSAYRPLGDGKAYILLGPKDPAPVADPVVYRHKVKVLVNGLAIRNRPRTTSAKTGSFDKGQIITTTKLMRHGGRYRGPAGKVRTDWLGFTRQGRTDWVARAFTKVVA